MTTKEEIGIMVITGTTIMAETTIMVKDQITEIELLQRMENLKPKW